MKNIRVTAIRFVSDKVLKCERVDLRFSTQKELETHRDKLLLIFTTVNYTFDYE